MAHRFYCPEAGPSGTAILTGAEAHHLTRVLRLRSGELVEIFNGRGRGWISEVGETGKDRVELYLRDPIAGRDPSIQITLATAIPKGDRLDWLVEKATELGVARLVPLRSTRSTVDPRVSKLDRLRRAVVEASKQCGRNVLMEIADPIEWADFAGNETSEFRYLADPAGAGPDHHEYPARTLALAVGPEGGFTPHEVDLARAAGWRKLRLSSTILRIETAGVAGCALLLAGARVEKPSPS